VRFEFLDNSQKARIAPVFIQGGPLFVVVGCRQREIQLVDQVVLQVKNRRAVDTVLRLMLISCVYLRFEKRKGSEALAYDQGA
jgi:hypothetical protein